MVMSDRWRMSPGLRRASAVVAVTALAIGGAKVTSDHTMVCSGFSTMQTAAADPTGPTGGPSGGPGGMNGSQFQPPGLPPQMPDYQGGINQPPLDQNSGISIYNTGSPGAQQVPGQQAEQQPQQAQQPAHGTQIPDYSTAPGYTQGPGKPNPDFQGPQQNSPQPGQQSPQQEQQPQQGDQPSQVPTQTEQPSSPAPTQAPTQTQEPSSDQQNQENDERSSENGKDNTDEQCKQAAADVAAGKPLSQPELFRNDLGLLGSMHRSIDGNSLNYAVDDSALLDVVQKAANQWNYAKDIKVFLTRVKGDPDVIVKFGDFGETDWVGNWSKSLLGPDVISINKWFFKPNKYYQDGLSTDGILATVTHELGHALGLGHSCSGLVMHAVSDEGQAVSPQPVDIAAVNYGR